MGLHDGEKKVRRRHVLISRLVAVHEFRRRLGSRTRDLIGGVV